MGIIELLNEIGSCGAVNLPHRQKRYYAAYDKLRQYISPKELLNIAIAHNHYLLNEGRGELMDIVKELKEKYGK